MQVYAGIDIRKALDTFLHTVWRVLEHKLLQQSVLRWSDLYLVAMATSSAVARPGTFWRQPSTIGRYSSSVSFDATRHMAMIGQTTGIGVHRRAKKRLSKQGLSSII